MHTRWNSFFLFALLSLFSKHQAFAAPNWSEVDRLAGEQKFQAALEATKKVLQQARDSKDARFQTEALAKATQLEMALHGYETAVRFLKEQPWPSDPAARALLHLFYGQALMRYQEMYGYEIGQREKNAGSSLDLKNLKTWTTRQIGEEISRSYDAAMAESAGLDQPVPSWFRFALQANSYPAGVRPLLRDALVYLAVQHLLNQQFWSPAESNEVYRLGVERLARQKNGPRIPAAKAEVHPLEKAVSWLAELAAFHAERGEKDAYLEARYELFEALHSASSEAEDRALVRQALRALQVEGNPGPWWARGQALLGEFIQAEDRAGKLIDARAEALKGRNAFPATAGGEMCAVIVHSIESPSYSLQSMRADAAGKRSILVDYKNIRSLSFRAYPIEFEPLLKSGKGNEFRQIRREEIEARLAGAPAAEWSVDLPETKDHSRHRFFVMPPKLGPGLYLIVSSQQKDFSRSRNEMQALRILVTDFVLSTSRQGGGSTEALLQKGESGQPVEGVEISLYRYNWRGAPDLVERVKTNGGGLAVFQEPARKPTEQWNYFLVARSGGQVVFDDQEIWFGSEQPEQKTTASLVFTDRSVYRPEQKLHFKVVGYRGKRADGTFAVAKAGEQARVRLLDAGYQLVAEKTVKLGSFGSASGEFLIPAGKPLGSWQLQVQNFPGGAGVRVEEYKRPTFEASILESSAPLRLNQKAKLTGEARYYFGLPVSAGKVSWRVTRTEVAPWWWGWRGWWFPGGARPAETVATGSSRLEKDGKFPIEFTPRADERKKESGVSYTFQVEADITDEGGETRTASRSIRLGFVALEARLELENGFLRTGQAGQINAKLSDLDGNPLKGRGTYSLALLKGELKLPADLPRETEADAFQLEGDRMRARWETDFRWEKISGSWKEAEKIMQGKVEHNAKGEGPIKLPALNRSGVYRLSYRTQDAFGAPFEASFDFLVAGAKPEIPFPILVIPEKKTQKVGEKARVLVHSGFSSQPLQVEVFRAGRRVLKKNLETGKGAALLEFPVTEADRGGFTVVASGVRDFQSLRSEANVSVPWSDRELNVEFSTFRDKIRPGAKENFRITVKGEKGRALPEGAAEVLAYMYDRSLDLFAPHSYPSILSLYPQRTGAPGLAISLGAAHGMVILNSLPGGPNRPHFLPDRLEFYPAYGIGGPGSRGRGGFGPAAMMARGEAPMESMMMAQSDAAPSMMKESSGIAGAKMKTGAKAAPAAEEGAPRTNFSETAFFAPHLITGRNGSVSVEFTAPESVTSWKVLAHALTRDLRGGSASRETKTVKELMVRPYAPRFLREGDKAEIQVQVNNAGDSALSGELSFDIEDLAKSKSALADFSLQGASKRAFRVGAKGSTTLRFPIQAPRKTGEFAFSVRARAGEYTDGERRPFPVLPSRMHLTQSRFVTLSGKSSKTMEFADLARMDDPSMLQEKMVVTVDAQLFYGVLQALPYLVNYPYECVEQTMNRFLSTGIVSSVFDKFPAVAAMAKSLATRKSRLEAFNGEDPNLRMRLEESPWMQAAKGGEEDRELARILDPAVAKEVRESALAKLRKAQLPDGGFPWFQGGPPDLHMTLYILLGLSRAAEFHVAVPADLVRKAWSYVRSWLEAELDRMLKDDTGWESVTLLHFALSSYQGGQWDGGLFEPALRKKLLEHSFRHWKEHSPLLKGYLALTLHRSGRESDAKLVWDSVMDSAKHSEELGTYWAREDRSWLWYRDEVDTQAFALRTQMELSPASKLNEGLVQWLFLNKKLNQWKSTRATAEAIYALVHYLSKKGELGQKETISLDLGTQKAEFTFSPDRYAGKKNQIVIPGEKIQPKANSRIVASKTSKGMAFVSAAWHFSTEKLPEAESGDFFQVSRKYFRRVQAGGAWQLEPIAEGAKIQVGDQLEVQLSLRSKHEAEYVHLRDPRGAGFEPETLASGYKWDLGIFWYEETRDSGSNFFFSRLPVGEYSFKYRLRANMAGTFRVGPATVQSMYAPEFNAYSKGDLLRVE